MESPRDPLPRVGGAGQGDQAALLQLLEQHLPELRGFLHRHMGRELLGRESSADLVQSVCREVLERLAEERVQYRSPAEFKQWLYNAAMFKIRNRLKYWGAARRDGRQELPAADASQSEALFQTLWTPSQSASLKEGLARFEAALARLPAEQRQVIVQSRLEGRSHKEIAEQLGITESHSRVLLTRGLARLARLRDEQDG
jgi:RNA polymerase sigma factor (sigma-70 family)